MAFEAPSFSLANQPRLGTAWADKLGGVIDENRDRQRASDVLLGRKQAMTAATGPDGSVNPQRAYEILLGRGDIEGAKVVGAMAERQADNAFQRERAGVQDKQWQQSHALAAQNAAKDGSEWSMSDGVMYNKKTGETKAQEPGTAGAGVIPKETRNAANELRDEYNTNIVKPYVAAREGFQKVKAGALDDSATGDIALIFGFMRTLDPNSTVREGEFATAQNAGGVTDTVRNAYNRAISGERLNPEQRTRFISTARNQFGVADQNFKGETARYRDLSGKYRVDPSLVVREFDDVEPKEPKPPTGGNKTSSGISWSIEP